MHKNVTNASLLNASKRNNKSFDSFHQRRFRVDVGKDKKIENLWNNESNQLENRKKYNFDGDINCPTAQIQNYIIAFSEEVDGILYNLNLNILLAPAQFANFVNSCKTFKTFAEPSLGLGYQDQCLFETLELQETITNTDKKIIEIFKKQKELENKLD